MTEPGVIYPRAVGGKEPSAQGGRGLPVEGDCAGRSGGRRTDGEAQGDPGPEPRPPGCDDTRYGQRRDDARDEERRYARFPADPGPQPVDGEEDGRSRDRARSCVAPERYTR